MPQAITIKQSVTFNNTTPQRVYKVLMNAREHATFTGESASISPKVGGKFSAYGGYSSGTNLELAPGKKIVQEWRASDWEKGMQSIVTFLFSKTKMGTKLTFTHSSIPASDAANIKQGWIDFYWKPLREYLAAKK